MAKISDYVWFSERAILAEKNMVLDESNIKIQSQVIDPNEVVNHSIEFQNSLDLPGLLDSLLKML